jgi:hypothetical protein
VANGAVGGAKSPREAALGARGRLEPASAASEAPTATEDARWALRWQGWADWPLTLPTLLLAAVAVVLDVTSAWAHLTLGSMGRIEVSPALPLAVVLVAHLGAARRNAGLRPTRAWREYAATVGTVLVLATLGYAVLLARPAEAVGLVVAAIGEELVFRLAAVLVLGALCARLVGRDWRSPRRWGSAPGFVGLGAAAVLFSVLPGHVAQMTTATRSLSFASLALLLGYTVLRTGVVWPAILAHALVNVMTMAAWQGRGLADLRLATAPGALGALVIATEVAGRRLGQRTRVPTLIDLRARATTAGLTGS